MTTENNDGVITAKFEKDGVSAVLKNVDISQIGKLEFKDGIFTADPVIIDSATIRIPHCPLNPVVVKPKLYIREAGNDFSAVEPYCKNETKRECFNLVKVTSDYYEYNVEHFTDYYVNSSGGGNYTTLKDCLDAINNTANSCVITESGYYAIGDTYSYNISTDSYSGVIEAGADNITIDCNDSLFIGNNDGNGIYTSQTNTTIKNCHFQNYGNGIKYFNADIGLVEGCSVKDSSMGIDLWVGTNIEIIDSNFTNSSSWNIKLDGSTENISVVNVRAEYSSLSNLWMHPEHSSNATIRNSYFGNSSSGICVALAQSSAFVNNTVQNCLANGRAGLTAGTGSIVKDNLFYNNNVHIYLYNNQNVTIENNVFNKSNDADFYGFGIGFCLALLDNSADDNVINNTFVDCLGTGITMAQVNSGGNLSNNNITENVFMNTIPSNLSSDLYINYTDVENTNVWLNSFYKYGVNDSGQSTSFCVENEGNFYKEGIIVPAGDCGPLDITVPTNGKSYLDSINITWKKQSSQKAITYSLFYSNESGAYWMYIDYNGTSVSDLNYIWDISHFLSYYSEENTHLGTGLYHIKITPNDGLYNGTNINASFFVLNSLAGRPTNTSIAINLVNEANNISIYVEYGNESGNYANKTEIINATPDSLVEFNITGLSPDRVYYYRIIANDTNDISVYAVSDERSFRTRRASFPFNFTVLADSHIETDWSGSFTQILENMAKNDDSDFAIYLGDNVLADSHLVDNKMTTIFSNFRAHISPNRHPMPMFYVIGNHEEYGWSENLTNYSRYVRKKYIPNPLNTTYTEGGSEHEDYYAFTWGDALFVVLNVMTYNPVDPETYSCGGYNWTLGAEQLEWLNKTLKAHNDSRDVDWKFIFAHHPDGGNATDATGYASPCEGGSGAYGRGGGMAAHVGEQETVHNMMKNYSVQAFFYGHDHLFVNISVDGIQYIDVSNPIYKGFVGAYNGYTIFNDTGRARVEIISNETAKVLFINKNEDVIFNLTLNSTI